MTESVQVQDNTLTHGDRVVARQLAMASAERLMLGMEAFARDHGACTHYFPIWGDEDGGSGFQDALTVKAIEAPPCVVDCDADHLRICSECWRTGYRGESPCACREYVMHKYRYLWVDGPVDRATGVRMLAVDCRREVTS